MPKIADVLDSALDVCQRPSETLEALFYQTGDWSVELAAVGDGALGFAVVDVILDVVEEVLVNLCCTVDDPELLAKDVDGDDAEKQQHNHEPAALGGHVDQRVGHFLRHGGDFRCLKKRE